NCCVAVIASEATQSSFLSALDCFVADAPRNDGYLLPHILHHPPRPDLGAVDVASIVGRDAFGRARGVALLDRVGDERRHRAVLDAANADAALPAVVVLRDGLRLRIRHIDVVLFVDVDAARTAELRPLLDEL